jgi:hypothetical protein
MAQYAWARLPGSPCNFPARREFPACNRKEPASRVPNAEPVSHAHTPAHAAPAGEVVLGRYRLVRRIGAGGMGVVYLAEDQQLQREVAVKRIAIELDPDGRGEREAIAAARLSHPGIVALYESGRDDDAVYLVSELVRGRTLAEMIRDGDLSDRDVVEIGVTLCDALAHAHARGVIHRDVKPSNVICPESPQQGGGVAKLTDFGIALMADGDVLTRTGNVMGTLAYMAPEQARGQVATGAADVYALGVVLFEGLSGVNPIRGGNLAATMQRVGVPLPALAKVRRDLPSGLCRAIDAAVAVQVERRAGLDSLRLALTHAVDRVADEPGPIATDAGVAHTARTLTGRTRHRERDLAPPERPVASPPELEDGANIHARRLRVRARETAPATDAGARGLPRAELDRPAAPPYPGELPGEDEDEDAAAPARRAGRLRRRALAGTAAGVLTGAALAGLGPQPPLDPAVGALAASLAVLLAPGLGWMAMAGALVLWLAVTAPGLALLVLFAAAPVPLALGRRAATWSLPVGAPLLGLLGLAGAWPALAGQARRWDTRAALGALGGLWLAVAETLTGERLLTGQPREVLAPGAWGGSLLDGVGSALAPLLSGGTLAFAALWAVAAAILPLVVRGRSAQLDLVAATGWAAWLAASTQALSGTFALGAPHGLVVGALAAAVVAIAARAARGRA